MTQTLLTRFRCGFAVAFLLISGGCTLAPDHNLAFLTKPGAANICTTGSTSTNPARDRAIGGIGGTGQIAARPGIGGAGKTEIIAAGEAGGIGGTGIVGVVTGFASICVNDAEIHYSESTPVFVDGERGSVADLLVGQLVAVRASDLHQTPDGEFRAQQIAVRHAVVGPLTQLDIATGEFSVMNQKAIALHKSELADLKPGDWVRLSGQRLSTGLLHASHVQALGRALPAALVRGQIRVIDGRTVEIGSTPVLFRELPNGIKLKREISVRGRWNGRQLDADEVTINPTRSEIGSVRELILQGYVQALNDRELVLADESLRLSPKFSVAGGDLHALGIDQYIQVHGFVSADGTLVIDRLKFIGEFGKDAQAEQRRTGTTAGKNDAAGSMAPPNNTGVGGPRGSSGKGSSGH